MCGARRFFTSGVTLLTPQQAIATASTKVLLNNKLYNYCVKPIWRQLGAG